MPKSKAQVLALHAAVVTHFDHEYGRNESRLVSWQRLCRNVSVEEGTSITQCKKKLRGTFINIVDFVQARNNGTAVRAFASAGELSRYMKSAGREKFFPLAKAEENPILRWMLIHVR
ncbi:hypothetical protein LTR09_005632 [Extremus antarcticus]|uniref:Uncharacterized protein n=1 Tax=Extremus antarcticus TaxID=702011 RepID=A0AAJ0GC69_9PEZI|nr:hypothetical protein LTR09_005632 [Extremus antarcticus]